MHQQTLVHLAVVRQHGDNDRWLDSLLNDSTSDFQLLGLNYALYNLIFRDGVPMETSWHYNSIWLEMLTQYAPLLQKTGRDPFAIPKVRPPSSKASTLAASFSARLQAPLRNDHETHRD